MFYPCECGVTQERTKLIESHISNLKKEAKQHALSHFLCGLNIAHSGVHLQLLPISITSFAVQTWTDRNVFVHFRRHAAGLCECFRAQSVMQSYDCIVLWLKTVHIQISIITPPDCLVFYFTCRRLLARVGNG